MGKLLKGVGEELSLYVRQVAWLQAIPKDDTKKKLADPGKAGERKSRFAEFQDAGIIPALPPNPAPWLTEILMEIGPSETTGMGPARISWQTLGEWQRQMDVRLEPWQLRLLRRLSIDYIVEGNRAETKGCASPWATMTLERRREVLADKVDRIFGALAETPLKPRKRK